MVLEIERLASSIVLPLSNAPVPAYKWAIELPLSFHNVTQASKQSRNYECNFQIQIIPLNLLI